MQQLKSLRPFLSDNSLYSTDKSVILASPFLKEGRVLRGKIIVLAALLVLFFGIATAAETPTEPQSGGCVAIDYLDDFMA